MENVQYLEGDYYVYWTGFELLIIVIEFKKRKSKKVKKLKI